MDIHCFFVPHDHGGHEELMCAAGGAFAASPAALAESRARLRGLDVVHGRANVGLCHGLASMLTDSELDAVLAHEYAHVLLDHLDCHGCRPGAVALFVEMEADMVAARVVGAAPLWSALVALGAARGCSEDPELLARLDALWALM